MKANETNGKITNEEIKLPTKNTSSQKIRFRKIIPTMENTLFFVNNLKLLYRFGQKPFNLKVK